MQYLNNQWARVYSVSSIVNVPRRNSKLEYLASTMAWLYIMFNADMAKGMRDKFLYWNINGEPKQRQ